ncbi:MAG: cation-translocating P-type ATPase [Candidatus Magasanikbacteria bacterium]|nr:cation-translocating P-type ATPase [Candidatus Magasanikbacteria bacterium]
MNNSEILLAVIGAKRKYAGLSSADADERLKIYGPNFRLRAKKRTWIKRLRDILGEPMMILIITTSIVYFFIGEMIEAVIFAFSVIPIGFIQYLQQQRTDRAVAELDKMLEEMCKVYRDKRLVTLGVKNLVPGDMVHLVAGDKIPADGYILYGNGLMVDEAVLTGESMPATKKQLPENLSEISGEHKLYQGTLVSQGDAEFLVMLTGEKTEYGQLGSLLEKIVSQKTPLQKKIIRLIRGVATMAISAALLTFILLWFTRGLKEGLLGGLSMAMSLIPEEFPVVFSVFLVMGVWRLAKKNALVRQMVTVETLGSATVICTDKTGTLTEGRMSLREVFYNDRQIKINGKQLKDQQIVDLVKIAVLSLERVATDPLEIEMQRYALKIGIDLNDYFNRYELIRETSFDADTKMVHHLWCEKSGHQCAQYSVGAPETIIKSCSANDALKEKYLSVNEQMAKKGYRVIALATKACSDNDKIEASGLLFVGLLAMEDPPREKVREAIAMCQEAGVRVIMITGDNKLTAHTIAESIGLHHSDEIKDGDELQQMSPAALKTAVIRHNIFSRVRPEHKFLIIEALQKNGEIVAMTGDGVNDAPALKRSDIGVAMGRKGTEVAREAADMILLDDNFFTIARAVKEGRKIYRNLQQAFVFLISFHLPIVALAVVPLLFGQPLIFLPIHIIFLELICDPASVLGFENEKAPANIMRVPPRPANEPLIPAYLWRQIIIQTIAILIVTFGFYWYFAYLVGDLWLARTVTFISLVISQIMLVFSTREWRQIKNNLTLTGIGLFMLAVLLVIVIAPPLIKLFHFTSISFKLFSAVFAAAFSVSIIAGVLIKYLNKRISV